MQIFVLNRVGQFLSLLILMLLCSPGGEGRDTHAAETWQADRAGYQRHVQPFVTRYCVGCHGPQDAQAEFRVDQHLENDFLNLVTRQHWREFVNVLNSHEMPPEGEPQPDAATVSQVIDWVTQQMIRAELQQRETTIVLRRMNRAEYKNTIRDLLGVDYDVSLFPQDPPAGGFDNNGKALTFSPLLMELYVQAAGSILDQVLVTGERPPVLKWRIEPESGDSDSNRVTYDGQRLIVNGGRNRKSGDFTVMHHASWDRTINTRDFRLPHAGPYVLRIRAAGKVPSRDEVVASADKFLTERRDREIAKNPSRAQYPQRQYEETLAHFRTDRMYEYGPPRLKLIQNLGGQPKVIAEFDVPAPLDQPEVYEVRVPFSTEKAGITIEYAYSIPRELENFWFQTGDDFARPELWVDWLEIEGPVYDAWPPASHQKLLGESASSARDESTAAREILTRFLPLAYRRPVKPEEIDSKLVIYQQARREGDSDQAALKAALTAVLASPHFLFLTEPAPARELRPLNGYEIASRLSYFLWSSMPDEELFSLAKSGRLRDPQTLTAQVNRMLADPKSAAFVKHFAGQWLGLRNVGANPPAQDLFPRYDRHLESSIVQESEAFFAEILHHDLPVMNFVKSDFVVINERLGRFYGIPGVRGDHFRRVSVPPGVHRGGVITQASVLTITSNGTRTSPVKRGTWVMTNILGTDPGLPVANAGDIAPKVPGLDKATVRQRLEIHRELPQCARCHAKIDPLGFGLENFNAAGEYRDREGFGYQGRIGSNDPLIDASAKLPNGTEFVGVSGLQEALRAEEELFLNCLAGKLFTYALGRELGLSDRVTIQQAVKSLQAGDPTLRRLITFIVTSEPFLSK